VRKCWRAARPCWTAVRWTSRASTLQRPRCLAPGAAARCRRAIEGGNACGARTAPVPGARGRGAQARRGARPVPFGPRRLPPGRRRVATRHALRRLRQHGSPLAAAQPAHGRDAGAGTLQHHLRHAARNTKPRRP